jgi:hypothetical protein
MDRSKFIAWAKQLTEVELAVLFYEILGDFPRSPADYYHGEATKDQVPSGEYRLVIAEAGYFAGFSSEPAGHDFQVIAPPADYSSLAGSLLLPSTEYAEPTQAGSCKKCSVEFTSWSKLSQCPICGTENWGT